MRHANGGEGINLARVKDRGRCPTATRCDQRFPLFAAAAGRETDGPDCARSGLDLKFKKLQI